MRKKALTKIVASLCVFMLFVPGLRAQIAIDYERMDRDIRIMENVIQTLLSIQDVKSYYTTQQVKGTYLDDYGAVFQILMSNRSSYSGESAEKARASFETLRNELEDFLFSYGGLIKQLGANDVITLVANMSGTTAADFALEYAYLVRTLQTRSEIDLLLARAQAEGVDIFEPAPFIMTVNKSDLTYAQNLTQFKDMVSFKSLKAEEDPYTTPKMYSNIKVMGSILETVIESRFNTSISSTSFLGTYIKDYGVLFTINAGSSIRIYMPELQDVEVTLMAPVTAKEHFLAARLAVLKEQINDAQKVAIDRLVEAEARASEIERTKNYHENTKELIEVIANIFGDYGQALRELKPEENVTIIFSSTYSYWGPTRDEISMMFTAKYKDILDYSKGIINLETFRERINTRAYE